MKSKWGCQANRHTGLDTNLDAKINRKYLKSQGWFSENMEFRLWDSALEKDRASSEKGASKSNWGKVARDRRKRSQRWAGECAERHELFSVGSEERPPKVRTGKSSRNLQHKDRW